MTRQIALFAPLALGLALLGGCARAPKSTGTAALPDLSPAQKAAAEIAGVPVETARELEAKPLYQFSEAEVDRYLGYVQALEPSLPQRVVKLARKNLGQPYEIYLLGEAPIEMYDPQPLYELKKSDCVVFSEHTYAMALSEDWPTFFRTLQRIRYKDGEVSVLTRNHYTEVDWDKNNTWLLQDVTNELGAGREVAYSMPVDRAKFFRDRYKLETDFEKIVHEETYLPLDVVLEVQDQLRDGDFVNFVRGNKDGGAWVGHVGLVAIGPEGKPHIVHSTPPKVIEQSVEEIVAKARQNALENPDKAQLLGFKFLRLEQDPMQNLRDLDGPDAPKLRLTQPGEGHLIARLPQEEKKDEGQ